jgi:hypothetical protein
MIMPLFAVAMLLAMAFLIGLLIVSCSAAGKHSARILVLGPPRTVYGTRNLLRGRASTRDL